MKLNAPISIQIQGVHCTIKNQAPEKYSSKINFLIFVNKILYTVC